MRLLCTLNDQQQGFTFASYLKSKGINNEFDVETNKDWGSPDYGTATCRIWVIEEDQVDDAQKYYEEFEKNPSDVRFKTALSASKVKNPLIPVSGEKSDVSTPRLLRNVPVMPARQPIGAVTLYTLILCTLLLFFKGMTSPEITKFPANLPAAPVESPKIYKLLYYDYPKNYEIVDTLISKYGLAKLENPNDLPPEGKALYNEFTKTPYWNGIYDKAVHHLQQPDTPWNFNAPLFEKERKGEIWRLFTPALLHANIFHLVFNMLMLVVLGRQMEQKMGSGRYLLFILITGIVANTAQYFMSGISFLGFSGVLCAMLTFVWFRQKKFPWEGYQLAPSTMGFITVYILLLFTIQFISFISEVYFNTPFPAIIANSAHLTGAFMGWALSKLEFFGLQQ